LNKGCKDSKITNRPVRLASVYTWLELL
jgi:hypothetical protein